jgi:uncharacterized radical SAM superfamily protein
MVLALYAPGTGFMQVSVTGERCELMCKHCGARFLRHMKAARTPGELYGLALEAEKLGFVGMLISGGCDSSGKVPLADHFNTIKNIKKNTDLILNMHTGFPEEGEMSALARCGADVISFDVVGSNRVLTEVYGLSLPPNYFDGGPGLRPELG